jgi:hypothetical protein
MDSVGAVASGEWVPGIEFGNRGWKHGELCAADVPADRIPGAQNSDGKPFVSAHNPNLKPLVCHCSNSGLRWLGMSTTKFSYTPLLIYDMKAAGNFNSTYILSEVPSGLTDLLLVSKCMSPKAGPQKGLKL